MQSALRDFEKRHEGLKAEVLFMPDGWYARFVWPDWPRSKAEEIKEWIGDFHRIHSELCLVPMGSREWLCVSHGCEADYESAEAIANSFNRHFNGRVRWVESEKDTKGRVAAECLVEGAGEFHLELSWRSCLILPVGALRDYGLQTFSLASQDVVAWARQRIKPILDELKRRLEQLYGDGFRGLYVFGSYARPDAGIELPGDSDLDVALLLSDMENRYDEISRFGEIVADLSLEHGIVISVVPILESDYKEGRTNFTRVISEHAIRVE